MPIQRHTDQANRLTTYAVTGELVTEELMEVVAAFKNDPPTLNILWDFSDAYPTVSFGSDDMKQIAELVKRTIGSLTGGRTAFVAASDLMFGVLRMYKTYLAFEISVHETNVFRTLEEAHQWLESGN